MKINTLKVLALTLLTGFALVGCGSSNTNVLPLPPTATPKPTPAPTAKPTPAPTAKPTPTPGPTHVPDGELLPDFSR